VAKYELLFFFAAVIAAAFAGQLIEYLAGRNVIRLSTLKAKALARVLPFYAACFSLLVLLPSSLRVDAFWMEKDPESVGELVRLLRRQSEALGMTAELVPWFITFIMVYVGYILYYLLQHANGAKVEGGGNGPR
jgi:hypothetical protein